MLASSAGVVVLAPAAHATTSVDNDSFVTMVSQGDYVGQGKDYLFTPAVGDSVAIQGDADSVTVSVSGDNSDQFTLDLAAPTGSSLSDGAYVDAERTAFRAAGHPGIDVYGDGRGCDNVAGQFDVLDIATAGDGTVDRLDLTYVEYCEGDQSAPLFGQVSINEPAQDPDLIVVPTAVDWPDTFVGVSARIVPVRLINTGATSTTVSSLGASGDTSFSIKSDGCSGKALAVGAACVVNVGFAPSSPAGATATLTARDDTTVGHQDVSLSGAGIGGYTTWTLASDPGDYIGAGTSHAWTPLNSTVTASGDDTGISTSVVAGSSSFTAQFDPGSSQVLVPGTTYSEATRAGVGGTGPALDVSGNGAGCNTISGQFTVQQADFDPISGALEDFALTFVQHCEGQPRRCTAHSPTRHPIRPLLSHPRPTRHHHRHRRRRSARSPASPPAD